MLFLILDLNNGGTIWCCQECNIYFGSSELLNVHLNDHLKTLDSSHAASSGRNNFDVDERYKGNCKTNNKIEENKSTHGIRVLLPDEHKQSHSSENTSFSAIPVNGVASLLPIGRENNQSSNSSMNHLSSMSGTSGLNLNSPDCKPFNCPICPRTFDRQYSLQRHIILHKADKKYECNDCDAKYSLSANLTRHQRQVHSFVDASERTTEEHQSASNIPSTIVPANKENVSYINCRDCPLSYQIDSEAYKIHRYSHEARNDQTGDPFLESRIVQESMRIFTKDGSLIERIQTKFLCTDCTSNFTSWEELVEHSTQHGVPIKSSSSTSYPHAENNNVPNNIAKFMGKPHKCELCYKSFASEERLSVSTFIQVQ